MRFRELLAATALMALPAAAHAHPHVWTDAAAEIVFDDKGRIAAIRHHWRFDEAFSAYALQGLDIDRDGKYSAEELEPLARENVESLKDFDFFTVLSVGDYQAGYAAPTDYSLELMGDRLLLHFTLPLAAPLLTRATAVLEIGDPEYYVAFSLPSIEAVRLINAPASCRLTVHPGEKPDAAAAAALAEIGADQRQLPDGMQALAEGTENSAEVNCGGPPVAPANAGDAAHRMASAGEARGDLTALPAQSASADVAAQADAQPVDPAAAVSSPQRSAGLLAQWSAWIGAKQTEFNHGLTAALKSLKDGGAFWWLGGVSFLYGIVHAAGPGHGKVVISSYLLANEARIRRGVVIAFIAAFVQAAVAIGLIGVLAILLNMTSMAIDSTARVFEAGSFALVAALGLYLLAHKGRAAWAMAYGGDAHAHHHHHHHTPGASPSPQGGGVAPASRRHAVVHDHGPDQGAANDHGPGHDHGHENRPSPIPSPQGGGGTFAGAAAAIMAIGVRPCSGALVVLVFALSQGVFWAGAASTLVMALGTAMTVAVLAALAVGAKGVARRLAQGDDRRAGQVMLGLELAAALAITMMGVTLFFGTLYA